MKLTPRQRQLRLQIIFTFMIVYAGLLFVIRPDPTRGQVIFRGIAAAIGVVGLVALALRRRPR